MTPVSPDRELVTAYAKEGCETAFRSLVARHVDLVYATALRQVGDAGMAEEVTQNVFMALARKAPRLGSMETLAGWLHRTALLEAKARIRAELRRQRREDAAARLASHHHDGGDDALAALVPMLDEALLNLRETDRLALVLRYLDDRSLRDVGSVLGVDEDAARKRVSRALGRVTEFFRQRGFTVPAGTGAAAIFANATQAAPAAVVISTAQAGLAAGGAATGFNLLFLHLMALTKTQTAVVCALLVAAPLAFQQQAVAEARQRHDDLSAQLTSADDALERLQAENLRGQNTLRRAELNALNASNRLASLRLRYKDLQALQPYRWDDASPLVRVPKAFLKAMSISGMGDKRGTLSEQIKVALQMTPAEAAEIEAAARRFLDGYHAAQAATMKRVEPDKSDLNGKKPEDVRVFTIGGIKEAVAGLREELFRDWKTTLDEERAGLLVQSVSNWMPTDDERHGLNSSMAVVNFDHRLRFYHTPQKVTFPWGTETSLGWGLGEPGGGGMWMTIPVGDIPQYLRPHLQDWINEARSLPKNPEHPAP